MKCKIITSLLVLLIGVFSARAQQFGLSAQQVVEKLYSTYDINSIPFNRVEFEKRKANWFIKTLDYVKGQIIKGKPQLFYNGKKGYVPLGFDKNPSPIEIDYHEYMDESEAYNYNMQPYYGYEGWYKDVIKEYGVKLHLTDDQLYALARAYSSKAGAPLVNQAGDAPRADIYHLPLNINALSGRELHEFITTDDSAISKFHQLSLRNPRFVTRVGTIGNKYANEVMYKFSMLLTFSQKAVQQMVLPKKLYSDSMLAVARGYLSRCPKQGIFVSLGDNDFYPLLYVQQAESFRQDVYVINYNLMGIDKFIYRMSFPQFDSRSIVFMADTSLYKGITDELVFIKDSVNSILLPYFIELLKTGMPDADGRITYAGDHIMLPIENGANSTSFIEVSLEKVRYLLKNEWILLDIINDLNGRAICFPYQFTDDLKGLNDHLVDRQGLLMYDNQK